MCGNGRRNLNYLQCFMEDGCGHLMLPSSENLMFAGLTSKTVDGGDPVFGMRAPSKKLPEESNS